MGWIQRISKNPQAEASPKQQNGAIPPLAPSFRSQLSETFEAEILKPWAVSKGAWWGQERGRRIKQTVELF